MKLDIKKALLSPFSDSKWFIKVFWLSLIILLSGFYKVILDEFNKYALISGVICLPLGLIFGGFILQCIHNEINNRSPLLPAWSPNLFKFFKQGMVYVFIIFVYMVPLLLFADFIFNVIHNHYFLVIFGILFMIFLALVTQSALCIYSDNFKFEESVDFVRLFKLAAVVKSEILITLSLFILLQIINMLFDYILTITIVGILLIPFLIVISLLMSYNLAAQTYRIAKQRLEKDSNQVECYQI